MGPYQGESCPSDDESAEEETNCDTCGYDFKLNKDGLPVCDCEGCFYKEGGHPDHFSLVKSVVKTFMTRYPIALAGVYAVVNPVAVKTETNEEEGGHPDHQDISDED